MTDKTPSGKASAPATSEPKKATDPLLGPSAIEREEAGDEGTRPVEDYPIDEKITPPAEQTRAARATVIGQAEGGDDPQIVDSTAKPADTKSDKD